MAYQRKTKDVYVLMGNYGYGYDELLTEDTYLEALQQKRTYQKNERAIYKIIKKREVIK